MQRKQIGVVSGLLWGAVWTGAWGEALSLRTLDVGQAECHLVVLGEKRQPSWVGLVDSARAKNVSKVRKALRRSGARRIDMVFLTHAHKDHCGGLAGLTEHFPIREIVWPGEAFEEQECAAALSALRATGTSVRAGRRGDDFQVSGQTRFLLLHPARAPQAYHDDGLVVVLEHGRHRFLFTGDASPSIQKEVRGVLESLFGPGDAALDWVSWPHHGDSLDPSWVQVFRQVPWIVVSLGRDRHVANRREEEAPLWSRAWRTDRSGSLTWGSDGQALCREKP